MQIGGLGYDKLGTQFQIRSLTNCRLIQTIVHVHEQKYVFLMFLNNLIVFTSVN